MNIEYNGKVHETIEFMGLIVSDDKKIVFGEVGKPLQFGTEVVQEATEEATEEDELS